MLLLGPFGYLLVAEYFGRESAGSMHDIFDFDASGPFILGAFGFRV